MRFFLCKKGFGLNGMGALRRHDGAGLAGLSLEDGAKLDLASDAVAAVKVLYVEGAAVPRGIYTGTGVVGTQVSWLEGDGILGVAGSLDRGVPSPPRTTGPSGR